jgi:hypothetical protein
MPKLRDADVGLAAKGEGGGQPPPLAVVLGRDPLRQHLLEGALRGVRENDPVTLELLTPGDLDFPVGPCNPVPGRLSLGALNGSSVPADGAAPARICGR